MKTKITKTFRSKVKGLINKYNGTSMFMVLEPVKINLWTVLFKRNQILEKIETNYIILENKKVELVYELSELFHE